MSSTFLLKNPRSDYSKLEALYRHLHSHPELSLKEEKTSEKLAEEFEKLGLRVTRCVGGTGVVAVLENGSGHTVMLRCDMDALPVTEATGLPYASRETGAMHACGHDVHMTCAIGAAEILSGMKGRWKGTLVFIAQPAEERGEGAKAMIDDGLFTRFSKPDFALALHVDSQLATDTIGYRSGPAFANVDSVDITIFGRGGHGAYPQLAVDPIVIASETILAFQTVVSREIKPYETAVITVGSIHGGTKHNIISDQVKLQLTVRSYSDEVRNHILRALERIAIQIARAHRAPKDPEMGGEDFALYGRAGIPAFMFRIGSVPPEKLAVSREPRAKSLPSLHSSCYAPDPEPTISLGVQALTAAVLELLGV